MDKVIEFFKRESVQVLISFFILILIFWLLKNMMNLFLLTFLFIYLIFSLEKIIYNMLNKFFKPNHIAIFILLYILIFTGISLIVTKYAPVIFNQTVDLINDLSNFNFNIKNMVIEKYAISFLKDFDIISYLKSSSNYILAFARNIGIWGFNVFMAVILSIIFIFEKDRLKTFMHRFENSSISWFYRSCSIIGRNFLNTFGKVLEVQVLIAVVNTVLSAVILGFMKFPHLVSLVAIVFFLSLIPVAGVLISFIPLGIIAYNVGGLIKVFYVIIMLLVLHAIESYFLNPKFMSDKTKLPVFVVFSVLIISDHFFKVWGLLLGIPVFVFILNMLNVKLN